MRCSPTRVNAILLHGLALLSVASLAMPARAEQMECLEDPQAVAKPLVTKPLMTKPIVARPAVARPAVAKPVSGTSTVRRPATRRQVASKTVAAQPAAKRVEDRIKRAPAVAAGAPVAATATAAPVACVDRARAPLAPIYLAQGGSPLPRDGSSLTSFLPAMGRSDSIAPGSGSAAGAASSPFAQSDQSTPSAQPAQSVQHASPEAFLSKPHLSPISKTSAPHREHGSYLAPLLGSATDDITRTPPTEVAPEPPILVAPPSQAVPAPGSLSLLGVGFLVLIGRFRKSLAG